jgi:hypothetical protein
MEGNERWKELCRQIEVEKDSAKFIELVIQLNRVLAEKQARITRPTTENSEQSPEQT